MKLKITWPYVLGFASLGGMLGLLHELLHHIAASIICGCFGHMTFTYCKFCEGCDTPYQWIATLISPVVFNYIPMWIAFFMMCKRDISKQLFGFTLAFCSMPLLRIVFSLLESNDEVTVVYALFGDNETAILWMKIIVLAVGLPPLIKAFLVLKNNYKLLWYLGILIIPGLFVFFVIGILLENVMVRYHVLDTPILGVPILVLLANLICIWGFYKHKKALYTSYIR